jgi:hypothetical protein
MTFLRNFFLKSPLNFTGRVTTANEQTVFDSKHLKDKLPLLYNEEIIGAGTSVWNTNLVQMNVTSGTDTVIRKSYRNFNYESGIPINFTFTFSRFESQTNVTKRFGCYTSAITTPFNSDFDGAMIETTGTQTALKIFRSGVQIEEILKTNWLNGADSLNLQFGQVFKIQFLWLGYGGVRLFADVAGEFVLAAEVLFTDFDENPFFSSPNKPIRYEIRSDGGAGTFNMVCSAVGYEGRPSELGVNYNVNSGFNLLTLATTGTRYIVAAFRLKSTHLDMTSIFKAISVMSSSNDNLLVELYYAGTPSAPLVFSDYSPSSNLQAFIASGAVTNTLGGVSNDYRAGGDYAREDTRTSISIEDKRGIGSSINGTPDVLYVCVTPMSAALSCSFSIQINDLS